MRRSTGTTTAAMLCQQGAQLPTWAAIEARCGREEEDPTPPRVTFYRDANAWCPFSHRVWFYLEEKRIRFATRRVHLRSDPREPAKPDWYLALVPSGVVPAVVLDGEVITGSAAILFRLEKAFPEPSLLGGRTIEDLGALVAASDAFDCDADEWLRNTDPASEARLRLEALAKLEKLESLVADGFFAGAALSLADAAFVGFLTRTVHNYKFFKGLDVLRDDANYPNLRRWFATLEASSRGYRRTRQEAHFEQRIYQAHPRRRRDAERCMGLDATRRGVGEAPDYAAPPLEAAHVAHIARADAQEAARILHDRRGPLVRFLRRKLAERETDVSSDHRRVLRDKFGKLHFDRVPGADASTTTDDDDDDDDDDDEGLRALAALLATLHDPDPFFEPEAGDYGVGEAAAAAGGAAVLANSNSLVCMLPELIGTPRDMPADAAAAVRGAVRVMRCAAGAVAARCATCGVERPNEPVAVDIGSLDCATCRASVFASDDGTPMEMITFE